MNKNASIRKIGDITIVELKGKITIGTGDLQMREAIHAVLNEGARKLVVDMSGVTTIDSSGVGELVGCYTTSTHKGAKMKLMNLPAKISDVLTVTQLITVFDVYPNEAEAIASFAS
jgi:anti-sigma B factor antagonist